MKAKDYDSKSLTILNITDPESKYLKKFYKDIYAKVFPKEEREDIGFFKESLKRGIFEKEIDVFNDISRPFDFKRDHSKEAFYVAAALYKDNIIGGIAFDLLGCAGMNIGIIWWSAVEPDYQGYGIGSKLADFAKNIMENDAKKTGCSLEAVFAEINNPERMTKKQIDYDIKNSMDPFNRIRFWRRMGYKAIEDFKYIQLTCCVA